MTKKDVVLKYTPRNDGDHLLGVPQRDLTADDLAAVEPYHRFNLTAQGPDGKSLYTPVEKKSEKKASKPAAKAAPKADPKADAPAKDESVAPARVDNPESADAKGAK